MAADYATLADLQAHWSALPVEDEAEATQKLHEASIEVRALYPDLDARLEALTLDPDLPRLVVCRMVKRAMTAANAGMEGVQSTSEHAGGVGMNFTFTNPDGALYLTAADKRLLAVPKPARKAWTIMPGGA